MNIIDISMTINETMTVYKNKLEKKPLIKTSANHAQHGSHETTITLNLHTGTHIDAPLHMIPAGATIENYPLSQFITRARVIDMTLCTSHISKADLIHHPIQAGEFVLLKTRNSFLEPFDFEFVYLAEDAATYLQEIGVAGVGIDSLGIERNQSHHPTHTILLSNHIAILEGLRLGHVEAGVYLLICLPLKIDHVEASLTRAVLVELNSLQEVC